LELDNRSKDEDSKAASDRRLLGSSSRMEANVSVATTSTEWDFELSATNNMGNSYMVNQAFLEKGAYRSQLAHQNLFRARFEQLYQRHNAFIVST
jgi:hypothetical protein